MMVMSEELKTLIQDITSSSEFWRVNYYMRSLKKAPHGGVFHNPYPNVFLKYYPVSTYLFFTPNSEIPMIVRNAASSFRKMIDFSNVSTEELLRYCLCIDTSELGNPHIGSRMCIATCGKVIISKDRRENEHMAALSAALDGRARFTDNFHIDEERLRFLFIFTLVECFAHRIYDINEIVSREQLMLLPDKYGLSNVTDAKFERQGFKLNDKFYLYNVFLDTSIGSLNANMPNTIEIIKNVNPPVQIFTRCDENLSVSCSEMVSTATEDSQKWRGITLCFDNITEQIICGRETVVHFDPLTLHKILVYIKKGIGENCLEFYHINVEQLWNPDIFMDNEEIIITNYIHGTYYPEYKAFEHIDFSVNQYNRIYFECKYRDAEKQTGISIGAYGQPHYKIWCVRGSGLVPRVWADLVCASLDMPFRSIFMETIGGSYTEV